VGGYGQQYIYACLTCQRPAAPAITPAATAIEWDREPGPRIGERRDLGLKPLEAGTLEHVARGILKLSERPLVVPLHRLTDPASRSAGPVTDVLATLTSQQRDALVVQVGGNLGRVVADGRIHRHPRTSRGRSPSRCARSTAHSIAGSSSTTARTRCRAAWTPTRCPP
jgi:hypothetical protein